jgi:serine/threonine protein kinase
MKAIGRLSHPNIVQASDAGEVEGTHFLVMEFVEGVDLGTLVTRLGPLPVPDACELVRQAATGLQHAHEHDLVHRDLKPSNLMLTPVGVVKVLDLGLAHLCDEVSAGEKLTAMGELLGTADYMAPEQAFGSEPVDIRADIYSLGCTLYHLLTGRVPYTDAEYNRPMSKLLAHVQTPAPPIRGLRPEVPQELAAVLDRLLAKAPNDRFRTPVQVAVALEPFAGGSNLPNLFPTAELEQPEGPETETF